MNPGRAAAAASPTAAPSLFAQAAALGGAPCAAFDPGGARVWANPAAERLAAELGPAALADPEDLRRLFVNGRAARRRVEFGPSDAPRAFVQRLSLVEESDGAFALAAVAEITAETRALHALRELRQRSGDLMSLISDCVWETDAEWRLTHFALRAAGPDAARAAQGRSLFDLGAFVQEGRARPPSPRLRAIFRRQPFRMVVEDAERVFLLTGMPLFDPANGAFLGFRGSGEDVTASRAAEADAGAARAALMATLGKLERRNAELDAALSEARKADLAKSEFLARMSHEFRTPLNAVIGLSSVLKFSVADRIDSRHLGCLNEIETSGRRLLSLVEDVLEFAHNAVTPPVGQGEPVDLGGIVREAAEFLRAAAARRGVDMDVDAPDGCGLHGDRKQLTQVFVNIIGNAIKFTNDGGRVSVSLARDGATLRTVVADTGIGIPAEHVADVFAPFEQVDGGVTRIHEGVGLGLALAKQLVERHGGAIGVESAVGVGTRIAVTLPQA